MSGYVRLLSRNPNYTRLWIAQAISLLGDWFSTIALSTLIASYTQDSGLAIGLLLLSRFLPPLVIGPLGGVLADRLNRKHLLIFSDGLRTVIVLMFLLVNSPDRLWLIYALTVMQFSLSALFDPARSALIPSLVGSEDLVRANLLGSVTWSVMLAFGAAIGGFVAATFGTPLALVVDSASFALSAAFISSIRWQPPARQRSVTASIQGTSAPEPRGVHEQLGFVDGLRYTARHPATAVVLLIKMGGSIGNIDTLMVIYATRLFVLGDNGNGSLGLLYAFFGLGAILGPVLLDRYNNGTVSTMRRLILVGYGCITLGWFLFGGAPTLLLAAMAILVKAMGSSIYWTYSSVIIQKLVPDKFLGRLSSLDLAGFQLATVASTLVTSWLIDRIGAGSVRGIVFGSAVVSLLPLILWALVLPWIERQDAKQPVIAPEAVSGD